MKILVLGVSGMLGHKVLDYFAKHTNHEVLGTALDFKGIPDKYLMKYQDKLIDKVDALNFDTVAKVITEVKPDVVINCIGIIKQNDQSSDWLIMLKLNSELPHLIVKECDKIGARFITIATDCVFNGKKGEAYLESDEPTCNDAYGMTKYLGEIHEGNHLTLRTSIIGHELTTKKSLLEWFLNEPAKEVKGFTKAIYSGVTTLEYAKFIDKYILENKDIKGLYHLSVNPISKHDLLIMVAEKYGKEVKIVPTDQLSINRSLDSTRLREALNYEVKPWQQLIDELHEDYLQSDFYK